MNNSAPAYSVDDAAIGRLYAYLHRAEPVAEHDELIARDAFMEGFRQGARYAIRTSGALSSPEVQAAVHVLAELLRSEGE